MARKQNRQRKLKQEAKRVAKRQRRTHRDAGPTRWLDALDGFEEAEELLASSKYDEAIELLEELVRRFPRDAEIVACLAQAYLQTGDQWSYQAACEQLTLADPDEPMSWLALGSAALSNAQPAAAQRAFAHVVATWPDHPETAEALELEASLRAWLVEECRHRGLDEKIGFRILQLHDEVNLHLHRGRFDKVCDVATRLLIMCPTFAPALNNRSEARFRLARFDEAIADCRQVLKFDPTNYHALANLTRYQYLSGQFDEAQTTAAALKERASDDADLFVKKAEVFAFLGDWQAVLESVEEGKSRWAKVGGTPKLAEHLAGVALANRGDLKGAQQCWRRAATGPGAINLASENLQDSKRPVGQRHGPWAFPLNQWVPRGIIADLLEVAAAQGRPGEATQIVKRHFARHPQLELLADPLLDRSDPVACEMLIRLAPLAESPALFAALKKFALGQRGSDDLRMQALMMLSQAGYIEGQIEVWQAGILNPVGLIMQEIYDEPTVDLPPEINDLLLSASDALLDGRGAEAQRLFEEVQRLRPDDLSIQFNRAVAIQTQGRKGEALEIIRRLHRDHPDYVFARAHLADVAIAAGDLEQAKTLLLPLAEKRRLHRSEHAAWCSTQVNLALALGNRDAAQRVLSAWEQVDPDNRQLKIWKSRFHGARGLLGLVGGLFR